MSELQDRFKFNANRTGRVEEYKPEFDIDNRFAPVEAFLFHNRIVKRGLEA
ncbi:MAG: hypothetical protein V7731_16380 [Amphritea sp.]